MRRVVLAVIVVSAIIATVGLIRPSGPQSSAAQVGTPVGTPEATTQEAELADLRNRVAALSTQVAELGGVDQEAVKGRLGGSRAGFDDLYGRPAAYLAPDEVAYDVPNVGRVSVLFQGDRATRIVAVAPRAADAPLDQPDSADWPDETALNGADALSPFDATMDAPEADGDQAFLVSGTSEALTAAMAPADALGCPVGGATPYFATFTRSAPDLVSVIVVETAPPGEAIRVPAEPVPAAEGRLAQAGSRTMANSSLGGTVSVNGVRLVATSARPDAEGPRPTTDGYRFFTVDLRIANDTTEPLTYELGDFVLLDHRDNEATAICGGAEPAITRGELEPGSEVEGIVTFEVPERFRAERLVVLVDGARVGFRLR